MDHIVNYDSLLLLTCLAFITPFFISKIKIIQIPYQVGEIFVGIIFGQSFLNWIKPDIWIVFISHLGVAYLMFLGGLEIDFEKKQAETNKKLLKTSIFMYLASLIAIYIISLPILNWMGMKKGIIFFILLFTASAPGLLIPYLKHLHILNTKFGQQLLIFSFVCEFICLIGFSIIASTAKYGFGYKNFLFLIVFLAAFLIYLLIKNIYHLHDFSALAFKNLHIGVRAAFTLILVLVSISEKMEIEVILGSFLAGIIFSIIAGKAKEEISHQLDVIGYGFLIPIFFIMVGVQLDLKSVIYNSKALLNIPIFLFLFYIAKLIPSLILKNKFCNNKVISASFILTSQLSLVIVGAELAYELKIISDTNYSALIVTTIISCILFPAIFNFIYKKEKNEDLESDKDERILIRETKLSNPKYFEKEIKECSFNGECRVFMVIRDGFEIFPRANTILQQGDTLVLVGIKEPMDEVIEDLLDMKNLK